MLCVSQDLFTKSIFWIVVFYRHSVQKYDAMLRVSFYREGINR